MKKNEKGGQSDSKTTEIAEKTTNNRRKFLAGISTGVAAAGVTSGGKWVKPVVDSVILPSHAQTSAGPMTLQGHVNGNEFDSNTAGTLFTDGTYPITSDEGADFDDFNADFSALFQPAQANSVSVNLDVNIDSVGGDFNVDGALSQTSSANVPVDSTMRANFDPIDIDADGADTVTVVGTVRADGFATRRITYIIT